MHACMHVQSIMINVAHNHTKRAYLVKMIACSCQVINNCTCFWTSLAPCSALSPSRSASEPTPLASTGRTGRNGAVIGASLLTVTGLAVKMDLQIIVSSELWTKLIQDKQKRRLILVYACDSTPMRLYIWRLLVGCWTDAPWIKSSYVSSLNMYCLPHNFACAVLCMLWHEGYHIQGMRILIENA